LRRGVREGEGRGWEVRGGKGFAEPMSKCFDTRLLYRGITISYWTFNEKSEKDTCRPYMFLPWVLL